MTDTVLAVVQGLLLPGLLGFGGAWFASIRMLSVVDQRVAALTERVGKLESEAQARHRDHIETVERLARLETKLDMALAEINARR